MTKKENIYLTKKGYELFLKEIDDIQARINNNGVSKSSAYTSAVGDGWHDNFEFEDATREERRLLEMLREKRSQLSRIVIVADTDDENLVNVGDFVKCVFVYGENDIEETVIHLIGTTLPQRHPDYLDVTISSPVGRAIHNQPVGSTVKYKVEGNEFAINIEEKIKEEGLKL